MFEVYTVGTPQALVDAQVLSDTAVVHKQHNIKQHNGKYTGDMRTEAKIAACSTVDPDMFFSKNPKVIAQALMVCAGCEMQSDCKTMNTDIEHGVWGGVER